MSRVRRHQYVAQPWRGRFQRRRAVGQVSVDDQHFRLAVVGDERERVRVESSVGGHGHRPNAERAEEAFDETHVVGKQQQHATAASHAEVSQQAGGALGAVLESA